MKVKIGRKNLAIKDCKGIKSVKGLMFSEMQDIDGAMIYANNIWMPFVKHELDLLFLDENYKIIEVQSAKPLSRKKSSWKIYKNERAKYCLELKKGTISAKKGIKVEIIRS
jgi:uncharacterized membrane protein (UPF0127 family)